MISYLLLILRTYKSISRTLDLGLQLLNRRRNYSKWLGSQGLNSWILEIPPCFWKRLFYFFKCPPIAVNLNTASSWPHSSEGDELLWRGGLKFDETPSAEVVTSRWSVFSRLSKTGDKLLGVPVCDKRVGSSLAA